MDSQVDAAQTNQTLWSVEKILDTLDYGPKPEKPEAIRQARLQRDALVPRLIEAIETAVDEIELGDFTDRSLPFFSLFLLTELQAKEGLPAILRAVSLPDDGSDKIFGDATTEYLYVTFSTLADDSFEQIEQLILDPSVDQFVRGAAIRSYLNLYHRAVMTRDEVIDKLREYLETAIATGDWELGTVVVAEIVSYSPAEVLPTIEKAFEAGVVDEWVVDLDFVEMTIEEGESFTRQEIERQAREEPPDTIEYLEDWYYVFRDPEPPRRRSSVPPPQPVRDETYGDGDYVPSVETIRNTTPKVGRNDPCTCGSGKKFKKCCGRT